MCTIDISSSNSRETIEVEILKSYRIVKHLSRHSNSIDAKIVWECLNKFNNLAENNKATLQSSVGARIRWCRT